MTFVIGEERITAEDYIEFLKKTDLGSQYPKERFHERISKLVNNVSTALLQEIVTLTKSSVCALELPTLLTGFL